jgi:hypothetical protein
MMRGRNAIIAVHFATLLAAYGLFESASFFPAIGGIETKAIVFFMSAIAAILGLMLVTWKSDKKDRITFVFSTIFTFVLLVWVISTR